MFLPMGRARDTASLTLKPWTVKRSYANGSENFHAALRDRTLKEEKYRGTGFLRIGPSAMNFTVMIAGMTMK